MIEKTALALKVTRGNNAVVFMSRTIQGRRPDLIIDISSQKSSERGPLCLAISMTRRSVLVGLGSLIVFSSDGLAQDAASRPRPVISQKSLSNVRDASQRLIAQSRDSFNRGLVPLVDHLDQFSLAAGLNLRFATWQKNRETQQEWHRLQVRNLEGVTTQLERFQQPAAAGWAADVLLARLSLAQSQLQLATFEGRTNAAASAQLAIIDLARQHWDRRLDDATIGHAAPMQLWRAASLVFSSENRPLDADRNFLTQAIQATDRWNLAGSGLGREDLRDAFRFELARMDLLSAKPGTESFNAQAQRAEASAEKLFDTISQFQSKGTASMYDMASAWRQRQELHTFLEESLPGPVPADWKQRRSNDLTRLTRLATQTVDRRGRAAADVGYVELLALAEKALTSDASAAK